MLELLRAPALRPRAFEEPRERSALPNLYAAVGFEPSSPASFSADFKFKPVPRLFDEAPPPSTRERVFLDLLRVGGVSLSCTSSTSLNRMPLERPCYLTGRASSSSLNSPPEPAPLRMLLEPAVGKPPADAPPLPSLRRIIYAAPAL